MFLHVFHPRPIILEFGFFKIYWYGLIIALAVLFGLSIIIKLNSAYKKRDIIIFKSRDQIFDLCFYLVIFAVIGARIYEVFLFLPVYLKNPLMIFKIWNGGLAIHGAILTGILTIVILTKKHKIDLGLSFDLIAPTLALGQAIGRWGNYFNQELFGLPTKLLLGIPIDLANRPLGYESFVFFHPTFLYESLLNLILAGFLFFLHYRRLAKLSAAQRHPMQDGVSDTSYFQEGNIVLIYLIGYSLIRFLLEFIKIDETPFVFGLRWPQIMSLILIAVSGIALWRANKHNGQKN